MKDTFYFLSKSLHFYAQSALLEALTGFSRATWQGEAVRFENRIALEVHVVEEVPR